MLNIISITSGIYLIIQSTLIGSLISFSAQNFQLFFENWLLHQQDENDQQIDCD